MRRSRGTRSVVDDRQLDLFAATPMRVLAEPAPSTPRATAIRAQPASNRTTPAQPPIKRAVAKPKIAHDYLISAADIPPYPAEAVAFADEALAAAPNGKALFTYADIAALFGISRATVIRRQRSGMIPGVRFVGSRVLEDGHVRRFTREQVRYLLMASRI